MAWDEQVEAYLSTLLPSTARPYRTALADFAAWYRHSYGEDPDPALLTDEEAREYRGYLSAVRNLKASSVNLRLSALRGLARFCGRRIETKGMRRVEPPLEPLSGRELGRLLAALAGDGWLDKRNVAIVSLMARADLRLSEVTGLDLRDVQLNDRSGWVLIRRGKGFKERRVPLSLETRKALAAYLEVRPARAVGEALFITRSGERMVARDVQRLVEAAARQTGIERQVTPHLLHHTFATRFLRSGGDLATLQAVLGHANLSTTARYLHPDAARVQEMVEGL